jgi:poly(3-hydroxybutyrate) depolymerase
MSMTRQTIKRVVIAARLVLATAPLWPGAAAADHTVVPLTSLSRLEKLERGSVTVSGLSSGGFFAHQFHVAHSSLVKGTAIAAGGPFACAEQAPLWLRYYPNSALTYALTVCSHLWRARYPWLAFWLPAAPNPQASADAIRNEQGRGTIDPIANLAAARVWLFAGGRDAVVPPATVAAVKRAYELVGVPAPNIRLVEETRANHGLPIEEFEGAGAAPACDGLGSPFLIDCDYDAAKLLLAHLYPDGFKSEPAAPGGRLIRFDQSEFPGAAEPTSSLHREGYVYVPASCANGTAGPARCRLHVAFHGCQQSVERIHDAFYRHGGYNRWAEANAIVVLYPQVAANSVNPEGCWDWWGYSGSDFFRRTGKQTRAVRAMLDRLLGN